MNIKNINIIAKINTNFKYKLILTIYILLLFLSNIFNTNIVYSNSENNNDSNLLEIDSKAAILIDTKTNKILYEKNSNKRMYPASTTKIMTAIIVLENSNLNDIVTASQNAVTFLGPEYSSANIKYGEQLTISQLLELLLVHSANDASLVLAEYIGGSINSFISIMNTKAYELGLNNTNFTNTYGGHDENHYTTASDLSKIMKYCIKNENFRKLSSKASCSIPATNVSDVRQYNSTNELIIPNTTNYYPYITCGKTGFTTPAGECLVASSFKNDIELISITLGGYTPSSRFKDTKKLLEYGYSNYSLRHIIKENDLIANVEIPTSPITSEYLNLYSTKTITTLLNNNIDINNIEHTIILNPNISAPINTNDILGSASYIVDDKTYSIDLISKNNLEKSMYFNYLIIISFILLILLICITLWLITKFVLSKNRNVEKILTINESIKKTDNK